MNEYLKILYHLLNTKSLEEIEENDFYFTIRMVDSLYDYKDDPPILSDDIISNINRLYTILLKMGYEVKEFKNFKSYKDIEWIKVTDGIVKFLLPIMKKEFKDI